MNKNIKYIIENYFQELNEEDILFTNNINDILKLLLPIFNNITSEIELNINPAIYDDKSKILVYKNILSHSAWIILEQYIYSILRNNLDNNSYFSDTKEINKTFDLQTTLSIKNNNATIPIEIKTIKYNSNSFKLTENQYILCTDPVYIICKYEITAKYTIKITQILLILGSAIDYKTMITDKQTVLLSKININDIHILFGHGIKNNNNRNTNNNTLSGQNTSVNVIKQNAKQQIINVSSTSTQTTSTGISTNTK